MLLETKRSLSDGEAHPRRKINAGENPLNEGEHVPTKNSQK